MNPYRLRVCALSFALTALASTLPSAQQRATQPPSVARAPQIGDALVITLLSLTKTRSPMTLLGISKFVGNSDSMTVTSNRTLIAYNNAVAVERGGRYTPPKDLRIDVLSVACGDPDLLEIFNCTRLTLKTAAGRTLRPITNRSGPQTYRNALGARWTARTIVATYAIDDLRRGFSVDYAADDGTEWTLKVSEDEANRDLLLTINPQTGEADQCAIRGRC